MAKSTPLSPPTPIPTIMTLPTPQTNSAPFSIIGYLPDYRDLNPQWAQSLTDIIYFSAEPAPDGTLDSSRLSEDTLKQLADLKVKFGTRIYISIGGWERSSGFAPMAKNPELRAMFIQNVLAFALAHNLDGVDVDWEFPQNEEEFKNSISLLKEMQLALSSHGLIVSVALSPDSEFPLGSYSVVDRIHIMSYDHLGQHSTYDQAVKDFQLFLDAGIPPEKLALGVPFYARGVDNFDREVSYSDIVSQYQPAHDADEVDGLYFNGIDTIQKKTCFAKEQHAGGVMIWELGQDTLDDTSLLKAIYQAATNGC